MSRKTLTLFVPVALIVGCTSTEYDQDFYDYDAQNSRTRTLLDAQIAKGAAEDKRMTLAHFDADCELTALGRLKLDGIVEGSPRRDLKVYLDFAPPTPERGEAMVLSVREHLAGLGVRGTPRAMDQMVVFGEPDQTYRSGDSVLAMDEMHRRNPAEVPATAGLFGSE